SSFRVFVLLVQFLQNPTCFMSQSTIGSNLKKSSLLLSAVLTLGLLASPAKADQGQGEVGSTPVSTPEVSQSEPSETVLTASPSTPAVVSEDTTVSATEVAPVEAIDSVSSTDLLNQSTTPEAQTMPEQIAQSPTTPDTTNVTPGRTTRSGSSYIGVGGNIGIGDNDTGVGEGSFAVFSKIGLTSNISARPSVLFSDDATILVPVTLDFASGDTEPSEEVSDDFNLSLNPYIGAGVAISTGGDGSVDLLATGGLDIPLSSRFTGTAAVNAVFFDNVAVGILLGVGYNF
ncbi:MAG: hypothetical protein SFY66_22605, partial [Oculatellaceae cyanobacterium bins.114]|nr:hypothetical protein [Oculatellaceae cyanobacterium bins.114]